LANSRFSLMICLRVVQVDQYGRQIVVGAKLLDFANYFIKLSLSLGRRPGMNARLCEGRHTAMIAFTFPPVT
jgi:hypothetical protein